MDQSPLRASPPPPCLLGCCHINATVCSAQGWQGLLPRDWLLGWLLILAALATGFLTRPSEAEGTRGGGQWVRGSDAALGRELAVEVPFQEVGFPSKEEGRHFWSLPHRVTDLGHLI